MFYKLGVGVCAIIVHILFKVTIIGRENVPKSGGYVLAANHRTNFDPLFVATSVKPQVFFMAKEELFLKSKLLGWIFRHLGAFPVSRGKGDSGAMGWAENIIRDGGVLGMFPEGTRTKTGETARPKSGTAVIANQTGADVLPCAVCYGTALHFRTPVTVRFGEVIKNSMLGFSGEGNSPREIKAASHLIMDSIVELTKEH